MNPAVNLGANPEVNPAVNPQIHRLIHGGLNPSPGKWIEFSARAAESAARGVALNPEVSPLARVLV